MPVEPRKTSDAYKHTNRNVKRTYGRKSGQDGDIKVKMG